MIKLKIIQAEKFKNIIKAIAMKEECVRLTKTDASDDEMYFDG